VLPALAGAPVTRKRRTTLSCIQISRYRDEREVMMHMLR
jgi:hypothetical protein